MDPHRSQKREACLEVDGTCQRAHAKQTEQLVLSPPAICLSVTDGPWQVKRLGWNKSVSSAMLHHSAGVASEIAQSNQGREREAGKRAHNRPAQMDGKEKRKTAVERSTERAPSPVHNVQLGADTISVVPQISADVGNVLIGQQFNYCVG